MQTPSDNDLTWLAFRFVAGEMTADERELFESRLADDEAACDAVEQAVEMSEALRLGATEPLSVPHSMLAVYFRHPVTWAACLLLAVSLVWLVSIGWHGNGPTNRTAGDADSRDDPKAGVSLAWAELRDRQSTEEGSDATLRWAGPAGAVELATDSIVGNLEATDAGVPQWLLTAVSAGNAPSKEIQ